MGGSIIFFFQAEDGIRGADVTGVQTCALPISSAPASRPDCPASENGPVAAGSWRRSRREIGRASCRERVEILVVAGSLKKRQNAARRVSRRTSGRYLRFYLASSARARRIGGYS